MMKSILIALALVAIVAAVPTEEKKDLTAEEANYYYRTYGYYPKYYSGYRYLPSYSSYKYLPSSYGYKYLPSYGFNDYYGYDYPSYYEGSSYLL